MVLDWKHVQGTQSDRPLETDTTSSPNCVYLRKDITRIVREDTDGNAVEMWDYDEAQLTPEEYAEYETVKSTVDGVMEMEGTKQIINTLLGGST